MLDSFFTSLCGVQGLHREVSDRAFARARDRPHMSALTARNDLLVQPASGAGLVSRSRGLRVIAGDGAVLMPAVRACHLRWSAASADQRLSALVLPGVELTLHASVYSAQGSARQMLVEARDALGPDDVLVLDRSYPAAWLVAPLGERGVRICIRCNNDSGWLALPAFMRPGVDEAWLTLKAPSVNDAEVRGGPQTPVRLRRVRHIARDGAVRVAGHQSGRAGRPGLRIRQSVSPALAHRGGLQAAQASASSGMRLRADPARADHRCGRQTGGGQPGRDALCRRRPASRPPVCSRRCNRTYAATQLQRMLLQMVLPIGDFITTFDDVVRLLAPTSQRSIAGRSRPRAAQHAEPRPSTAHDGRGLSSLD